MAHNRSRPREDLSPSEPRIGRDEMNLAEFPIALLADRAPRGQKTLYFEDQHGRLTVTGSDAYGLPTATDTDVIVALIYLTKLRNDFRDVRVNFSRYELIKLLNWSDESWYYKRIEQSFHRWSGVLLVYDKCWWDNRAKRYLSANMHIIDSVVFAEPGGHARGGQSPLPLSIFTWNKTFIESCQADNLRQLDLDTYFSLNSAIAKRLYRFLGKRFYRQDDWTFDLNEVAFDRVGLSRNYADAYKIKEKLQPAIEELEAIGFLRPLRRDERYTRIDRGQWTIRLTRDSPLLAAPRPSPLPDADPEPPLVADLVHRGVTRATAEDLARNYPAEQIARKIEVFDWLTEERDRRIARSPAGYLVKSIEQDYAPPRGFLSRAERQRQAEARQARERQAAEEQRRRREDDARARAEQRAVAAYWGSLTPRQQASLQAQADAQADPADLARETGLLKRLGQQIRRQEFIRRILQERAVDA